MRRAVGIAIESTRTALVEGDPYRDGSFGVVGDGFRRWAPNASTLEEWGTAAIGEQSKVNLTNMYNADLSGWTSNPWTTEFLTGVRRRFEDYLGRIAPVKANGYDCFIVANPESPSPREITELARVAGLTDIHVVRPTEALIAAWLAQQREVIRREEFDRIQLVDSPSKVVAVACGAVSTVAQAFRVEPAPRGIFDLPDARLFQIEVGEVVVSNRGAQSVVMAIAGQVLDRRRDQSRLLNGLAMLDAVDGFAELLALAPQSTQVRWGGLLEEDLRSPFWLSPEEFRQLPECRAFSSAVSELAIRLASDGERTLFVLGGPGASWPLFADNLADLGSVVRLPNPDISLATGACHIHLLLESTDPRQHPESQKNIGASSAQGTQSVIRDSERPHGGQYQSEATTVAPWLRES